MPLQSVTIKFHLMIQPNRFSVLTLIYLLSTRGNQCLSIVILGMRAGRLTEKKRWDLSQGGTDRKKEDLPKKQIYSSHFFIPLMRLNMCIKIKYCLSLALICHFSAKLITSSSKLYIFFACKIMHLIPISLGKEISRTYSCKVFHS